MPGLGRVLHRLWQIELDSPHGITRLLLVKQRLPKTGKQTPFIVCSKPQGLYKTEYWALLCECQSTFPFPLFAPQQLSFAQTDRQFPEDKWLGGGTGAGGDTECSEGTVGWGRQEEEELRDGKK